MRRILIALAASAIALAACGSSSSNPQPAASSPAPNSSGSAAGGSTAASPGNPVMFDVNAKTAAFFVVAGKGGGLNFDGQQNGGLAITVPVGWKVTITCRNEGNIPHSCAVVDSTSQNVVFAGASTPDPTTGFTPGSAESFRFTSSTPGSYRLACLVPGHEDAGMWAAFTVSSSAAMPQLQTSVAP